MRRWSGSKTKGNLNVLMLVGVGLEGETCGEAPSSDFEDAVVPLTGSFVDALNMLLTSIVDLSLSTVPLPESVARVREVLCIREAKPDSGESQGGQMGSADSSERPMGFVVRSRLAAAFLCNLFSRVHKS
jgi:hypothetical protein